ncbi:divergent protein kinase domain 2A-like isoform X1 [Phymastichus coffea]|uniref:divergent protein kinase domain 2A-like isoform X1 n=1 Tax=Phymastichus coffea TaxID=108790 RepID=UPI00273B7ACF|nr:divergent protein kinase domain 2A-like isoform X1 [Phymastichus coffea]
MLTKKNILISFFMAFFILMLKIIFRLNIDNLTEKEKCPACFGMSMCHEIHNIDFDFIDFYTIFNNLFSIKNVYYGSFKNKRVVMKKLAKNSELADFDEIFANTINKDVDFNALVTSQLINSNITDPNVKLVLCPSIQETHSLIQNIKNLDDDSDHLKYLWTILKINPEPIILEILNANDNWPTPKYLGACGRLIVEEFIGPPLSAFKTESWMRRAKIASSLLHVAHLLTFKNKKFAFYPTDISMDNIAVNEDDKAIIIDLENIIIVDKHPPVEVVSRLNSWDEIYTNDIDINCQNCFVFSPSDICQHKISDHNYYAICQHILVQDLGTNSYGLLHDPPKYIIKKYPMLKYLLKQCSKESSSRIDSGIQLKRLLDIIIKDHA